MGLIVLPEKHLSSTSIEDTNTICKPLFSNSPISYFWWYKTFDDGYVQILHTNREMTKYHLNIKNHLISPWVNEILLPQKKFYHFGFPSLNDKFDSILYDYKSLFNVHFPIYLIERFEDYYEIFCFASDIDDPGIFNFYLNRMDLLENFKLYFKDNAKSLIKKIANNRSNQLFLPEKMRTNIKGTKLISVQESQKIPINIKRYPFDIKNKKFSLSRREMEVVRHIVQGYTIKETAKILQLSPRTVEQYLNNVKEKTSLKRKNQVITLMKREIL